MHPRTVISVKWLGHERGRLAVGGRCILHDVLEQHQIIGRVQQIRVLEVDLALPRRRHLVVMTLHIYPYLAQDKRYRVSEVNKGVERRERYVTFLRPYVV